MTKHVVDRATCLLTYVVTTATVNYVRVALGV
jgi:hypothetical protein